MHPTFTDEGQTVQHPLELKFNASAWDILSAIEKGFRAQGDVKGKLAEWFLYKELVILKDSGVIEDVIWYDKDGKPDFDIVVGSARSGWSAKTPGARNPSGFREEVLRTLRGRVTENAASTFGGKKMKGL